MNSLDECQVFILDKWHTATLRLLSTLAVRSSSLLLIPVCLSSELEALCSEFRTLSSELKWTDPAAISESTFYYGTVPSAAKTAEGNLAAAS